MVNFLREKLNFLAVLLCFSLTASGCSVFMAAKQPGKKDLSYLDIGTPRGEVIAEFGAPEFTEEKDGKTHDIFKFVQGYSKGAKIGRAFFHGTADIFSLGLWEVVGTPAEAVFDGKEMKIEVMYDTDHKVENVVYLSGGEKVRKKE